MTTRGHDRHFAGCNLPGAKRVSTITSMSLDGSRDHSVLDLVPNLNACAESRVTPEGDVSEDRSG